jgi:tetratricopeptide (TPR) repeat protein
MNIDNIDEIVANADKFMENTVREYKDEIEKYSLEIERGNDTVSNYAFLFHSYRRLYEFTQKNKKYKCVTKDVVDNVCNKFLAKVQEEMALNQNMSENYCHLAHIELYKTDDKAKAIEYFDRAVELDNKKVLERGLFKNILGDKSGALYDYNQALELTTNENEREEIQFMIDHVNVLIKNKFDVFNLVMPVLYLIMAFLLAYGCYYFYMMIKVSITMPY